MCFVIPSRGMSFVNIVCTERGNNCNGAVGALFAWCNPIKNLHHTPALITSISSKNPTLCLHHTDAICMHLIRQASWMAWLGLLSLLKCLGLVVACRMERVDAANHSQSPFHGPHGRSTNTRQVNVSESNYFYFLIFLFVFLLEEQESCTTSFCCSVRANRQQDGRTDGKYQQLHWMIGVCLQTSSLMAKVQSCHLAYFLCLTIQTHVSLTTQMTYQFEINPISQRIILL